MSIDPNNIYNNPYAAPTAPLDPMPTFSKVMIIISLIFCIIRLMFGFLGFAGMDELPADHPLAGSAVYEVLAAFGIAVFGISGNALMLARQTWAVFLGYLACVATLCSVLVGMWQVSLVMDQFDGPERVGAMIGGLLVTVIRLSIVGMYAYALFKYQDWARNSEA